MALGVMDQSTEIDTPNRVGWPLTLGGVAAFASAGLAKRALVCAAWATACATICLWSINRTWVPAIEAAIGALPEKAAIRAGRMVFPDSNPRVLANNRFLTVVANPSSDLTVDRSSDIQVEIGISEMRFRSFMGWLHCPYPSALELDLSGDSVLPWWQAWKPSVLTGLGLFLSVSVLVSWSFLATLHTPPAALFARLLGRQAAWPQLWWLAFGSMMPGGALMSLALVAYAMLQIGMLHLCVLWVCQWLVGWLYLLGGIFCLPKMRRSPFAVPSPPPISGVDAPTSTAPGKNPFNSSESKVDD